MWTMSHWCPLNEFEAPHSRLLTVVVVRRWSIGQTPTCSGVMVLIQLFFFPSFSVCRQCRRCNSIWVLYVTILRCSESRQLWILNFSLGVDTTHKCRVFGLSLTKLSEPMENWCQLYWSFSHLLCADIFRQLHKQNTSTTQIRWVKGEA